MTEHLLEDETRTVTGKGGTTAKVKFYLDTDPCMTPWESDGSTPMVTLNLERASWCYSDKPARGYPVADPLTHYSDDDLVTHGQAILDALNTRYTDMLRAFGGLGNRNAPNLFDTLEAWDADCEDQFGGYDLTKGEMRREWLQQDAVNGSPESPRDFEFLAVLWTIMGVPALVKATRGYCQGDETQCLVVAHPDAVKAWGFADMDAYRNACPDDLSKAVDLYGAWAWGGIVGYVVTDADGEHVDSCWGFYPDKGQDAFSLGETHAYAVSQAMNAAQSHVDTVDDLKATRWAIELEAARPDLAPTWEGGAA
ncbi:MAG: hypothetical protein F6K48_20660 [Okeania sp. SIO3H1]|nr:hypothetical protein [Okeania sp. SIO3H1]